VPLGPAVPPSATKPTGPLALDWELVLGADPGARLLGAGPGARLLGADPGAQRGTDEPPGPADYARAIEAQAGPAQPAPVALPDLGVDLTGQRWTDTVLALLGTVAPLHDRLVVLDLPAGDPDAGGPAADAALEWVDRLTATGDDGLLRAAAVYHPRLMVRDPLGGPGGPLRAVPASGHVLGLIAPLDSRRGAHHTPGHAVLLGAVYLGQPLPEARQVRLFEAGVNLLRCAPGQGLRVWGGRTLASTPGARFVAHRRLVHQLVRAIRRVADPL